MIELKQVPLKTGVRQMTETDSEEAFNKAVVTGVGGFKSTKDAWKAWQARGELDAVRIKELEDEIIGWQGKSIEREQHLQIANSAVDELTAKLAIQQTMPMKYKRMAFNAQLQKENDELTAKLAKARKEDEANERWLAQLASECSDPNQ